LSTATIDAPKAVATENPEKQYRDCILRGEHPSPGLVDSTGRIEEDAIEDRETLAARRRAAAELLEADRLDLQAAKIVVPQPEDYGEKLVADCQTIAELYNALGMHRGQRDPKYTFVPSEKIEKRRLAGDARSIRGEAMATLADTADPEILKTGEVLGQKRSGLNSIVGEAGKFADLEVQIVWVERKMDQVRGDNDLSGPMKKIRLGTLKAERLRLIDQRPAAAHAAVAALKASAAIVALEQQRTANSAKMRVPTNMRFSSTELPPQAVYNSMVTTFIGTPNPPGI